MLRHRRHVPKFHQTFDTCLRFQLVCFVLYFCNVRVCFTSALYWRWFSSVDYTDYSPTGIKCVFFSIRHHIVIICQMFWHDCAIQECSIYTNIRTKRDHKKKQMREIKQSKDIFYYTRGVSVTFLNEFVYNIKYFQM